MLQAHRARFRLRDRPRMKHPVQVRFDPVASDRYTVVEVRAGDHVGLLHDLTRAMADLGAAIHQAYVTTEGERAVDAFYVTDPLGAPLDEATRSHLAARLREAIQKTG